MDNRHSTFLLSDKTYTFTKRLVQVILPAFSSFYFALAGIWDLPEPEKVVGTIAIFTTFLGVVIGISTAQYNASGRAFEGEMLVAPSLETGTPIVVGIHYNGVPEDLEDKTSVTFKIRHEMPVKMEEDFLEEPEPEKKTRRKPSK